MNKYKHKVTSVLILYGSPAEFGLVSEASLPGLRRLTLFLDWPRSCLYPGSGTRSRHVGISEKLWFLPGTGAAGARSSVVRVTAWRGSQGLPQLPPPTASHLPLPTITQPTWPVVLIRCFRRCPDGRAYVPPHPTHTHTESPSGTVPLNVLTLDFGAFSALF